MDLREHAEGTFRRSEGRRAHVWELWDPVARAVMRAVRNAAPQTHALDVAFVAPSHAGLDVPIDWHTTGVVVRLGHTEEGTDLELYARVEGDLTEEVTADDLVVQVHPIGTCRRCDAPVPLGPPAHSEDALGATLIAGRPAGHDCALR